ncbi:MAG: L,D-transpeptidase family protein [Nocardiopsaceae bacterium]|nr:L,D-transpeptidase family protein [Nocardiopsaceae bacterium]
MGSASRTTVILASGAALAVAGGLTVFAVTSGHHAAPTSVTRMTTARPPLRVTSVTPADGTRHVNGTDRVTVTFNQPLPASAPFPRLSPAVPGKWARAGDTATFTPATGFSPGSHVRVTVPSTGARTRSGYSSGFTTARYSTLRLQELLAQLGYLPMTWSAYLGGTVTPGSLAAQAAAAYNPPSGSFRWQGGYPRQLRGMWRQGAPNMLDTGAIAAFQESRGMRPNGVASPAVWAALLKAAADGRRNTHGYSYAIASESTPESLTIWHDGRQVLSTPANTGMSAAPTATGTYFVFEKLPFQVMQGTNPDGSHYSDPVQWVSYFNGGDAVHYFPRSSFGWPQSLGCVELPYGAAERSYRYLPYGTLVSVDP